MWIPTLVLVLLRSFAVFSNGESMLVRSLGCNKPNLNKALVPRQRGGARARKGRTSTSTLLLIDEWNWAKDEGQRSSIYS